MNKRRADSTSTPRNVANVSGSVMRMVVPEPRRLSIATRPPSFSAFSRTIASPKPRPDTRVIMGLVDTSVSKTSASAAASPSLSAALGATIPRLTAAALTLSISMPAPSSLTEISTCVLFTGDTVSVISARGGLPARRRCSGVSMPWSMQLRSR